MSERRANLLFSFFPKFAFFEFSDWLEPTTKNSFSFYQLKISYFSYSLHYSISDKTVVT